MNGLFWELPEPKSKEKRLPPEPVWLADDYLPGLEEAKKFDVAIMSNEELLQAASEGHELVCDIEIYGNYFLCAFMSMVTGKCTYIETIEQALSGVDLDKFLWIFGNFTIITFNGIKFDLPIASLAANGYTTREMKHACDMLIIQNVSHWKMLKAYNVKELECDHIDLIEVAPLSGSLKIYGGRLHVPKMQDLPFPPDIDLSPDQITIMRYYCINDLTTTAFINANLQEQLAIRRQMSEKYGVDLRSKSDAQIAEAVIASEIEKLQGIKPQKPTIEEGTTFKYKIPDFIKFETPAMLEYLSILENNYFAVNEKGSVLAPPAFYDPATTHKADRGDWEFKKFPINKMLYKIGIGGLHSTEENIAHKVDSSFKLAECDAASYYPFIILVLRLFPSHLGAYFLQVYETLVSKRIAAKKAGNQIIEGMLGKVIADMLKIVINGSFGKFGSKWSILFGPDLLVQVTITGQLSMLMLIERLELRGIEVVSANTDGIVYKHPRVMQHIVNDVVSKWEKDTGFETEETEYSALYSRDVNNYIAVKPNGRTKTKGAYSNPWNDPKAAIFRFHKNPTSSICVEAAVEYITKGTPLKTTINSCRDLSKFLTVRAVKGGAVKDGVFLGKAIRWYYARNAGGEIVYASSGNKVPKSDGARPCMDLPADFPADLDFERYEMEAQTILRDVAAA